jgi:TrmH family RNA methyltransferase
MISKAKASFIKSLQVKKYRQAEQCFIVQGAKAVTETLASAYKIRMIAGTKDFRSALSEALIGKGGEFLEVSAKELTAIGSMEENNSALAVVSMKPNRKPALPEDDYTLVLDDIRDPGNLGTIIRTADWYGIKNIIASPETTDQYNPKVINATMGSFLRVNVFYTPLEEFLSSVNMPSYGAFLDGKDIHATPLGTGGLIVIGNEARGISPQVSKKILHRITIPRFGKAESLNASAATAVILDNVRRRSNELLTS